jgi:hypothetical protein
VAGREGTGRHSLGRFFAVRPPPDVEADAPDLQALLDQSLASWLRQLKSSAESA